MNPRSIARHASLLLLVLAAATAAGCADDAADGGDGVGGGADDGADDDGTDPPGPKPAACPEPTKGPTQHDFETIETDTVWSADASPHIVNGFAVVRRAKLTIEPCAVVQFVDEDSGITVAFPGTPTTGEIVADGTADQPIVFEGQEGNRWGHVLVAPGGKASFSNLTMQDGGGYDTRGATLVVQGDATFPTKHDVFVDHLTVKRSLGVGVIAERLGSFAAGSTDLVVTESGLDVGDSLELLPYPVVVDEHAIDSLPRGAYVGNGVDAIHVQPSFKLAESGTMKNLGVPYKIGTFGQDDFVVGAGRDSTPTTLTIEPGVQIEMFPGTAFDIEHATGEFEASGAVVAEGTAADPIVFRSGAANPKAGDWRGLWFGGIARADNSFRNVRIEHTGADCGCILIGCSAVEGYEGAIIFSEEPPSAFFHDTVISEAAGNGVVLGYRGNLVDVAAGITFDSVAWCAQTQPHPGSCPNPLPSCE